MRRLWRSRAAARKWPSARWRYARWPCRASGARARAAAAASAIASRGRAPAARMSRANGAPRTWPHALGARVCESALPRPACSTIR
eukprot:4905503-Lingulodinium_polyedra.AAC.1